MAATGFKPLIGNCCVCGLEDPESVRIDLAGGLMRCSRCAPMDGASLGRGALGAARYIIGCELKKLFSFKISDSALRELASFAEGYLLAHLDRRFRTLEYYKGLFS
jgi:DNA repair protein RecO (recombination protein O)